MKKRVVFILLVFLFVSHYSYSQRFKGQIPVEKKYTLVEVLDSTYGINIYEKLIYGFGGDTVRNDKKGYACQGWMEDFYQSGKLLHKGYYVDGQLKIFKNYFENGQLERSYKIVDFKKSTLEVFYTDGKPKSIVEYRNNTVVKQEDYFPSGQLEYLEEADKNAEYVIQRKSFFLNGKTESSFELVNKKTRKYIKKEFYPNGELKEEGEMAFSENAFDYVKNGTWKMFDENGKIVTEEKYIAGELSEKIK